MSRLFRERWYPCFLGAVLSLGWYFLGLPSPESPRELLSTLVGLASIAVGFLATAMSIVVAAPEGPLLKQLRDSGYIEDLIRYLREPFAFGIGLVIACIAGYFLPKDSVSHPAFVATLIWLAATLLAGLFRISIVFMQFLRASVLQRKSREQGSYRAPR